MAIAANHPQAKDYQILELVPGAGPQAVKHAYRRLAKQWHPDRHRHSDADTQTLAERRFREITSAYQRLLSAISENRVNSAQAYTAAAATGGPSPTKPTPPKSPPRPAHTARKPVAGHRPLRAASNLLHRLFFRRSRYHAGLALGLLLIGTALVLLFKPAPRPHHTVIPHYDEDRLVLILPESPIPTAATRPSPEPRAQSTKAERPEATAPGHSAAGMFSLGASPEEVLRIQGPPSRVVGSIWSYNLSEVRFRQERVQSYNNFDGSLRVRILPATACGPAATFFTLGSSEDEVLCAQGTPTKVDGTRWYYGLDMVHFKGGEVAEYSNSYGNLRVRLAPDVQTQNRRGYFEIGSKKNEVLAIQGTPTEVRNNTWYYTFSDIQFTNDRVKWVNDPTGQLKFIAKTAKRPL